MSSSSPMRRRSPAPPSAVSRCDHRSRGRGTCRRRRRAQARSRPMSARDALAACSVAAGSAISRREPGVRTRPMTAEARVEFSLPARAENVALVRHAIAGFAEALEMEGAEIADLKTVVTEACMNVVVHAYEGDGAGPLEVEAWPDGRRPRRHRARLRLGHTPAGRRRAPQPAPRPAADGGAHLELRDQPRPRWRHRDPDADADRGQRRRASETEAPVRSPTRPGSTSKPARCSARCSRG